jgi:hypothetical protein
MTNLPEPIAVVVHDRRCEVANTSAYRLTCRCGQRAAAKALCVETGNAYAISNESLDRGDVGEQIARTLERLTRNLMHAVTEAGRVPVPSTVHLVSEGDSILDAVSMRLVALTVPDGTPLTDSLLEVADDWMRARGLRR